MPLVPSISAEPSSHLISLYIEITMDDFPREVSWSLSTSNGVILAQIPKGTYQSKRAVEREVVTVVPGESYLFLITDAQSDGLCCLYGQGRYRVYLLTGFQEVVLASSDGLYMEEDFALISIPDPSVGIPSIQPTIAPSSLQSPPSSLAPSVITNVPSFAPSVSSTSFNTISLAPSHSEVMTVVRVEVLMDQYPLEVGYTIRQMSDKTLVVWVPRGSFAEPHGIEVRSYRLASSQQYEFRITDHANDGICCDFGEGRYRIVAEVDGVDEMLVVGTGIYGSYESHAFRVPPFSPTVAPTTSNPSQTPSDQPSESLHSNATSFLTIEIQLDRSPEETGWSLQRGNSPMRVLASRGFGFYTNQNGMVREVVELDDFEQSAVDYDDEVVFVLVDAGSNGLCCNSSFAIYRGDPSAESLLLEGNGNFGLTSVHVLGAIQTIINNNNNATGLASTSVSVAEQDFSKGWESSAARASLDKTTFLLLLLLGSLMGLFFASGD